MEKESSDKGLIEDVVEVVNDANKEESEIVVPKVGMKFEDADDLFELFKNYGKHMGFPVRKRSRTKDLDGMARYVTYVCGREGNRASTSTKVFKLPLNLPTNCKAKVLGGLGLDGKWRINQAFLEHNHGLNPNESQFFRCNRLKQLKTNDTVRQKGSKKCVLEGKWLQLGDGDAVTIQSYFLNTQAQSTGFVFSMDLDEEGRLKNLFWADGRSREAYKEFGDVVTFDTSYLSDKYGIPLALFVGVNHHGQSMLLGCGLVSNKDMISFSWLFRTWLTCMSRSAPDGIITDQDKEIQNAIEDVFPETRHRWCLWHVMKKLPEKLRGLEELESVTSVLNDTVYDAQSPAEFEKSWSEITGKYKLHQNDWLSELYNERHRWVPCFVRTSFWAGMSTAKRNENISSFFDGHINSKTTLKEFLEHYDNVLRCKLEKESQSDFRSLSQMIPCLTTYEMEKQVQGAYTISKFKEFQEELVGKMYCDVISAKEGGIVSEYDLRENVSIGEGRKRMTFSVSFQSHECKVKCCCQMFELRGILCRHAILVLIRNDVMLLPDKYMLRRWRKDVRRSHTRVKITYGLSDLTPEQLRYDELCHALTKVADLAAGDEERYAKVMEWMENEMKELPVSRSSYRSNCATSRTSVHTSWSHPTIDMVENTNGSLPDPVVTGRGRGRPQCKRKQSTVVEKPRQGRQKVPSGGNVQDCQTNDPPTSHVHGVIPMHESAVLGVTPTQGGTYTPSANMHLPWGVYPRSPPIPTQHQFMDSQYGAFGNAMPTSSGFGTVHQPPAQGYDSVPNIATYGLRLFDKQI